MARYHARLPDTDRNVNVSHQHPVAEFFRLLAGVLVFAIGCYILLGILVDYSVDRLSPEHEASLFARINLPIADDPDTLPQQQAIQALVDELRLCVDIPYEVTVKVSARDDINAGVFPGGLMVVFSGLLDAVKSENGLAFVLAHELAHLKNRDHLRAMGRGVVLMSLAYGATGSSGLANSLVPWLSELGMAQHSQGRESQADALALNILYCHYGHVGGAGELFEHLLSKGKQFDFTLTNWFHSHPELSRRLSDLEQSVAEQGWPREATRSLFY